MINYQLRQREYLLQISRAMTSRLDPPSLLRLILTSVGEMVRAEAGLVALRESDSTTMSIRASFGVPAQLLPRFAPLLAGFDASRSDDLIPDLQARLARVSQAVLLPLNQAVALPLAFEDRLLGVIYLFRSGSIAFSGADRSALVSFADQAAIAVRNAQLYQQLRAETQRLNAVIEHSANGIMILDPGLKITAFNRALSRITGWEVERALGQPCYRVMPLEEVVGQTLCGPGSEPVQFTDGAPSVSEGVLVRPAGSRVALSVTYTPLYNEDGELRNIIANVVDITRFREAEEMKSTFISIVSHELKTPVALIKGYAGTLTREDAEWDRETVREGLQIIDEEADRLTALIDDLLDASRIQTGAFRIDRSDVCLPKLAAEVIERFKVQAPAHHFVLDFPPDYANLYGDEERLRQVFANLLNNALKYAPNGGEIRIGGWVEGEEAVTYVADEGVGIAPEEQAKVFQRFYRVDSGLRRTTQGTGLGLFLCKSIVEAHGGRIWLRSEAGKGTTVFFALPLDGPQERSTCS